MEKTYELGTKTEFNDHMYDMIKLAAKETGEVKFPHEPQRFIEIANLSIHYMSSLLIQTANNKELSYSVQEENCSIYAALKEGLNGDELLKLPCRACCLTAFGKIFEILEINDVVISQMQEIPKDGICTFSAGRK